MHNASKNSDKIDEEAHFFHLYNFTDADDF